MTPTLTVIIPTYNRAEYVRNCLIALRSSGVSDLEVIVTDDGSTDNTRDVVAETNPSALYLWQENTGTPATARNVAFARSRGRYVGFLDCDDEWLPDAPYQAVQFLDRHPEVDVLFADAQMGNPEQGYVSWIESAGQAAFFELPHTEPEPGYRILERGPFFRRTAERSPLFLGAMILRREAFAASGGFDPKLCGAADWDCWLRMAAQFTFAYMTQPLAKYTRHLDNMSSNQDHMIGEFCQALQNIRDSGLVTGSNLAQVRHRLRVMRHLHAYLAYDSGRYSVARSRFWQAMRAGDLRPLTAGYFLACCLPVPLTARLRRVKQAAARTAQA